MDYDGPDRKASTPSTHVLEELHRRLLSGDPVAPAQLAELVLEALHRRLSRKDSRLLAAYGSAVRDDALHDATISAFMSYVQRPRQYDPAKAPGGLLPFLVMAAHRDLLNNLRRLERRRLKETPASLVELCHTSRNKEIADESPDAETTWQSEEGPVVGDDVGIASALDSLLTLIETEAERKILRHMAEGERRTEIFAGDLGIGHLPIGEQRREVKRTKDRIKKRLERGKHRVVG